MDAWIPERLCSKCESRPTQSSVLQCGKAVENAMEQCSISTQDSHKLNDYEIGLATVFKHSI